MRNKSEIIISDEKVFQVLNDLRSRYNKDGEWKYNIPDNVSDSDFIHHIAENMRELVSDYLKLYRDKN